MSVKIIISFIFLMPALQAQLPHFFVVIPTYHNKKFCIENITALAEQTYDDWTACIVLDGKLEDDDGTRALLETYIHDHHLEDKVMMIQRGQRVLALANIYYAIHTYAQDDWVVVLYDGDDFFTEKTALERIAVEYEDPETWLTYGNYIEYPSRKRGVCRAFPEHVIRERSFRAYSWITSHPRTFYAWLFKRIALDDLMHERKFFPMTWDLAIMFPLLEMAADGHIRFIPDALYAYRFHDHNDFNTNIRLLLALEHIIRKKAPYKTIEKQVVQPIQGSEEEPKISTYSKLHPRKR